MCDKVEALLNWLNDSNCFHLSKKVGIVETAESGRGVVVTEDKLIKNEIIVSVPSSHQINYHSVINHIYQFNRNIKVSGVILTGEMPIYESETNEKENTVEKDPRYKAYGYLTLEFIQTLTSFQLLTLYILAEWQLLPCWSNNAIESFWLPFFNVWPTREELRSIPATWNCSSESEYKHLIPFLTFESTSHMERISKLILIDWEIILPILNLWKKSFPGSFNIEELFNKYLHIYFVINSRCLYCEIPTRSEDITSNFTLVPFVDFLNHVPEVGVHCYPEISTRKKNRYGIGEFSIRCGEKSYEIKGEQIFFNYGAHSNDFLLNEYGFVLDENSWNHINLSEDIIALFRDNNEAKSFLKQHGYWGDYTISKTDISYRLLVALSLLVTKDFRRVEKFISGYISEDYFMPKINPLLTDILLNHLKECNENKLALETFIDTTESDTWCIENLITIYKGYEKILRIHLEGLVEN